MAFTSASCLIQVPQHPGYHPAFPHHGIPVCSCLPPKPPPPPHLLRGLSLLLLPSLLAPGAKCGLLLLPQPPALCHFPVTSLSLSPVLTVVILHTWLLQGRNPGYLLLISQPKSQNILGSQFSGLISIFLTLALLSPQLPQSHKPSLFCSRQPPITELQELKGGNQQRDGVGEQGHCCYNKGGEMSRKEQRSTPPSKQPKLPTTALLGQNPFPAEIRHLAPLCSVWQVLFLYPQ